VRALVVGVSGLVGGAVARALERSGVEAVGTFRSRRVVGAQPLDVLDPEAVRRCLDTTRPDAIVLAVDAAADAHASPLHVEGARSVAASAAAVGARVVYYSSDAVFDGQSGPYSEDEPVRPIGPHGRLHAQGEQEIRRLAPHHLILRTSEVYGWDRGSRNLAMQVSERLQAGAPLRVAADRWGSPTFVDYLAEVTVRLLQMSVEGTVNVAGKERLARADLARALARAMALDATLIDAVPSSELEAGVAGPFEGGLTCGKLEALLGTEPLDLGESLKRFRRQWRADTHVSDGPRPVSTEAERLKQEILDKVRQYHGLAHQAPPFVPFKSRVQYAGRVFGDSEMVNLVDSALDFWLTLGPWGDLFEQKMKRLFGARDFVLVNSGSTANLASMMTLASPQLERPLVPGDEVITPAVTFPTTLAPIVHAGLTPVFVDCEVGTYNVDPRLLEGAISPRTRAIVVPHTLGNPCDMDVIGELVRRHELYLVEDSCDALGATFRGKLVGTFGDLATLSFFPAHHITLGEGGGVVVNNPTLPRIVRSVRDWGRDCFPAGTPVICRDAVRPIETVEVGHEVLTHEGRWRPVISLTGHRRYTRPLVTVRARLRPPVTVSASHLFWVRRVGGRQWVRASDLGHGDELIARTYPSDDLAAADFRWSYRTLYKPAVGNSVPVEPDLMRLVGYWLAEGSLARGRRGADGFLAYRVDFAFHARETALIADVKALMARYFGCTGWQRAHRRSHHGVSVSFKSRRAHEFFLQTLGRGARNKHLPQWMLELPDKHIAELLRGHWRGDGSASRQGFVVHSVSAELIEQLRLLMMRFGILASQWKRAVSSHRESVVNGKRVRATTDLHALSIYGANAERFARVLGEPYTARTRRRQATMDEVTGEAFFPVIEIRPFTSDEPVDVYNLEVEGDNSYHAAGVAVHNCWCAPGESNTCGKRFGWQLGDLPAGYDHKYVYSNIGYNFKPTDLQAAIGVAQADRLADFIEKRRRNFARLYRGLEGCQGRLVLPRLDPRANPSWFGFPITVGAGVSRQELVQWLESANIETRQVFGGNILKQPGYRHIPRRIHGTLEQTDRIMRDTFFVGVYPGLDDEMIDFVVGRVRGFFARR
jgi:dTDP-4-dehydrorhamnose reductase